MLKDAFWNILKLYIMEDYEITLMMLKCMVDQEEQLTQQEEAIKNLTNEMEDILATFSDDIAALEAAGD